MLPGLPFLPTLDTYTARALPADWRSQLYAHRWFKLFLPTAYGGLALPLPTALDWLYAAAACQGSLGWVVNLGSGAGYFWPFLAPAVAEAVFGPAEAVIAGSDRATGTAIPKDAGYQLQGVWASCSGAAHATHFTLNARLPGGEVRTFLLERGEVSCTDDWTVFGLTATSSWQVAVSGVIVPEERVFDIGTVRHPDLGYPLHRLAFDSFARYCLLATLLGLGSCCCGQVRQALPVPPAALAATEAWIAAALGQLKRHATQTWEQPETDLPAGFVSQTSQSLYARIGEVYYQGGMRLTQADNLAHHAWRDVMVACQHGLLK